MNKLTNLLNIFSLVAVLSMPALSFAGTDDGVEKKKSISKSYNVGSSDKLSIDNSFGDVVINTWDKKEFKVDVEIYAKAKTDELAQKILDKISVKDDQSGGEVWFKTTVGHIGSQHNDDGDDEDDDDNGNRKHHGDKNQEFHINYVVYMPSTNPLRIENQFGKTTVPDFKGNADITSKFGSLTAGNLDDIDQVDVEFGKGEIGNVHNGKVSFKFDSKSSVKNVSGSMKLNVEFSEAEFGVSDNIRELSLNNSYSTVNLIVTKTLSAEFTIHTNFGDFRNKTDFNLKEEKEDEDGPKFDKEINGTAGDGKGKIKIKSSFGEVRLSHDFMSASEEEHMERKEKAEKKERKEKKEKKEKDDNDDQS
ncbi:MAG TPA: hypothetical protein VKR53_07040 [Puia sp.]|nr:hypothetical protein [Puia sp.]